MQLKNSLYSIVDRQVEGMNGTFVLELNPSHVIYQAHFPGEPITPGVCIVQMGKELLEEILDKSLVMVKVKNVKFLSVVSPKESSTVTYAFRKVEVSEETKEVKAQIVVTSGEGAKAKVSFTCRIE